MKALLGRKLGMTQLFDENGNVVRATVLEAGPCVVTQLKSGAKDGYEAVQIGWGQARKPAKPQAGHASFDKMTPRYLREIKATTETEVEAAEGESTQLKVGSKLDVSQFAVGDAVVVSGTSKGKGFAGTIKRHNFSRGPATHGSHNVRQPGSIGSAYPEHVFKGVKMAGRMGGRRTSVKGLKVVATDTDSNLLIISGAVPGPRGGLIMIRGAQ